MIDAKGGATTMSTSGSPARPLHIAARVLLVDDQPELLRAYQRVLTAAGNVVETASDGRAAVALLSSEFDVVVSDISMPHLDGLALLAAVRARDLDLPVVLVTGEPNLEGATRAIEYGALRYLIKPVNLTELVNVVDYAARLHRMARVRREALSYLDPLGNAVGDRAGLEVRFTEALARSWMAFQPIVSWRQRKLVAYEALVRSDEASLASPAALLDAAERLHQMQRLGRIVRDRVADAAPGAPLHVQLFVNLHASDLSDDSLFDAKAPLSLIARRVVLEITERASLDDVLDLRGRIAALRALGFLIALDDLGAGYAGLTTFAQIEPEIVKLDMALIRDVDREPNKQKIVRSMTALCRDLAVEVVAEGIETAAERDSLMENGCDLMQGNLFARPARGYEHPLL